MTEIAIVAAKSIRTKAYLQLMAQHALLPSCCYFLVEKEEDLMDSFCENVGTDKQAIEYFDFKKTIYDLICEYNIPYKILGDKNINSDNVKVYIENINEKYLIYSGYGGCILSPDLFGIGKKWIHIHAGILPQYRGSTTAYYSMLDHNGIGATAIFMNEKIDQGDMIAKEEYQCPPSRVNIDFIYEPYIRAKLLVKILEQFQKTGQFPCEAQIHCKAETYYIIHPLLKHIAILGLDDNIVGNEELKRDILDE